MSELSSVRCDAPNCEKVRAKDSNHWLQGMVTTFGANKVVIIGKNLKYLEALPYYDKDNVKDFCGQACACKWTALKIGELNEKSEAS